MVGEGIDKGCTSSLTTLRRFIDYLPENMAIFVRIMQIDIPKLVKKTIHSINSGIVYQRPILVGALLDSNLSKEDKSFDRIYAESLALLGAGTETTAW